MKGSPIQPEMLVGYAARQVRLNEAAPPAAEQQIVDLGIQLPTPPEPFGVYAEAVQTGNPLFPTEMLPTENQAPAFVGRVGAELDLERGRQAARLAAHNALAVARHHLGSLDRITRVVRLGVAVALQNYSRTSSEETRIQPGWCTESRACLWVHRLSWK